ncbi:MAG: hypothetical protein Q7V19_02210, partial [Bacteroidales bacterium]|nr:hypothetical protein [Bacteroidales bacterium]
SRCFVDLDLNGVAVYGFSSLKCHLRSTFRSEYCQSQEEGHYQCPYVFFDHDAILQMVRSDATCLDFAACIGISGTFTYAA